MKQYATIIEQQQLKYKESHLELQHSLVRKIVKIIQSAAQKRAQHHTTLPLHPQYSPFHKSFPPLTAYMPPIGLIS